MASQLAIQLAIEFVALGLVTAPFVHELGHLLAARFGHLLAARCCKVQVCTVLIGVGPTLVSVRDREGTNWILGALPISGRCLFSSAPAGPPSGRRRSFDDTTGLQRASIFAAGPFFSLIFALLLLCAVVAFEGWPNTFAVSTIRLDVGVAIAIAAFSVMIAAFNLLPLLPLDGGQIALIALEAAGMRTTVNSRARYAEWSDSILRSGSFAAAVAMAWFMFASWS
ncbi:MAG: site-2 protease family protein [Pseudomonadota bacterium]